MRVTSASVSAIATDDVDRFTDDVLDDHNDIRSFGSLRVVLHP